MTLTYDDLTCAYNLIPADRWPDLAERVMREAHAMVTPITAEALLADGWGHDECWFDFPGSVVAVQQRDKTTFDVYVIDGDISKWAEGTQTMHDLRELVRLLGGAK